MTRRPAAIRVLAVLAQTLTLIIAGCSETSRAPSSPFRLSVAEVIDLGEVIQGDTAHATFEITALAKSGLKDIRIESGCGCTRALIDKTSLETSQSTRVDLWLDTEGRRQQMDVPIRIYAEADSKPVNATIACRAYVVSLAGLTIIPAELAGEVKSGDRFQRQLKLSIQELGNPLTVHRADGPDWMQIRTESDSPQALTIYLDGKVPEIGGVVSETLEFELAVGDRKVSRTVPIVLQVESLASFDRRAIVEQVTNSNKFQANARLKIDPSAKVDFVRIVKVESDPQANVQCNVQSNETLEPTPVYLLELAGEFPMRPRTDADDGVTRGTVEVEIRFAQPDRTETLKLNFLFIKP